MSASIWQPGTQTAPTLPAVAPVQFVPGTAAAPGVTLVGDTNTGIWSAGDGSMSFASNGVTELTVDALGVTVPAGKLSMAPELTLASAATCDIGSVLSNTIQITGTASIASFGTVYRGPVYLRFAASLILSNSANLILPGGVNITVAAGDTCTVMPKATAGVSDGWIVTEYTRAALSPPVVGYAQAGANADIVSLANLVSIQGGQLAGFRNKIIGGHFDTNPFQRGTSITVTATDTYVADKWKIQFDGTANITAAKVALPTPAVINGVWCSTGLKITVNSKAGNTFMRLVQCIEDVDTATTLPVVLQSAVQGSAAFAVACNLKQNFGAGGSPSASVSTPFTTTLAVTSAMQWLQTGATLPTIAGKTLGTTASTSYVAVEYDLLNVPTSGYLHIALSGVEQGLYASVWEDRRRVELSMCQRYYEIFDFELLGYAGGSIAVGGKLNFKVPKRIGGSAIAQGSSGSSSFTNLNVTTTSSSYGTATLYGVTIYRTSTGAGAFQFSETSSASCDF